MLHLVELSGAGLGGERSRAPARPYVGFPEPRHAGDGAPGARTLPGMAAAVGPCSADPGIGYLTEPQALDRAIAALRAGRTVKVGEIAILSVETGTQAMLDIVDPNGSAPLLLSGPRAMALGLGNTHDGAGEVDPVEVRHCNWLDRDAARAFADPARDFDRGPI